jgi:hypothetical protein
VNSFVPKREEVAGGWRRLHNEELHNLYCSTNIIRVMKSRREGNAARMGDMSNAYKILFGMPEGNRQRRGPRRKWEENIRINLSELVWEVCARFIWLRIRISSGILCTRQ